MSSERKKMSPHKIRLLIFEILMACFTLIYLYPFYAIVVLSLKSPAQALMNPMSLPTTLQLTNFSEAWTLTNFPVALWNTVLVTVLSVVMIILFTGMGSFVLDRWRSRTSTFLYYFIISGLMIPFYLSLSPSVKLMKDLSLMDSLPGLSLFYLGRNVSFAVFLFIGFLKGIPGEISESAILDGCRPFRLFWSIYFPLLKHIVSTLAILDSLGIWNDFLFPLLVIQSNKNRTLTLVQYMFNSEANTQWNLIFASYLMAMFPLLVLYFTLQKNIVEGIAAGAVKG